MHQGYCGLLFVRQTPATAGDAYRYLCGGGHLHAEAALGGRADIVAVLFAMRLKIIEPVLLTGDQVGQFWDELQHLVDEGYRPMFHICPLKRLASMDAHFEGTAMDLPAPRDTYGRAHITLTVNGVADGVNAGQFGFSHYALLAELWWLGLAVVFAHAARPLLCGTGAGRRQ